MAAVIAEREKQSKGCVLVPRPHPSCYACAVPSLVTLVTIRLMHDRWPTDRVQGRPDSLIVCDSTVSEIGDRLTMHAHTYGLDLSARSTSRRDVLHIHNIQAPRSRPARPPRHSHVFCLTFFYRTSILILTYSII